MQVQIVTLFPDMVNAVGEYGVVGRAVDKAILSIGTTNPRDFTDDVHRTVDDRPYGGGPGMVMKYEPLAAAIRAARKEVPAGSPVICLTPQGKRFDQVQVEALAGMAGMILLAGRYEGIDERLIEAEVDLELSLGDFVLSGGEIAAMAVIDAVARLLPGTLGDDESARQDSFADGLLDHPHYTRPDETEGRRVPDVLLSGNHEEIARWRLKEALGRSFERRPELLPSASLRRQRAISSWLPDNNTSGTRRPSVSSGRV